VASERPSDIECSNCHGTGLYEHEGLSVRCGWCKGSGKLNVCEVENCNELAVVRVGIARDHGTALCGFHADQIQAYVKARIAEVLR
jgi:hypothetical protein